ncbi:actin binding protein [Tieghemostelium lacteum]|uniref:Actin binding protein n=1 Tax=Tieghemostelium lacteum TaxID=361077 RepID=A0A152A2X2_TIELA|nr:actin binding protein [Tieghemostelium lacteum]|eukprot:KYR00554.1 actin binding protein [Tieghemostelium lacteum]
MSTLQSRRLVSTQSSHNVIHSYHDEEKQSLVEHLNFLLKDETLLKSKIPIDPKSDLIFDSLKDGIILCKLINAIKPGTLNENTVKLNQPKLNLFEMNVNLEKCLNAAKSIGCSILNIGPVDFQEGKRHLILSILWQLIKIDLLNKVTKLASRVRAEILDLTDKEKVDDLVPDEILVRWVNHHLTEAGSLRKVANFSNDIKDCEVYILLFHQLSPKTCTLDGLKTEDLTQRAQDFLDMIDKIGCKKFISTQDIVNGNGRLNIAFVAYLFNRFNQVKEEAPAVPSEVIKSANEKIASNQEEIKILEQEIQQYQEKHLEKVEKVKDLQEKIEITKQQDIEIQVRFEEKVQEYTQNLENQRSEYQIQIEQLEEQLKLIKDNELPSEDVLLELIEKEQLEIQQIQSDQFDQLQNQYKDIQNQTEAQQLETAKLREEIEKDSQDLQVVQQQLDTEKAEIIKKLDATGFLETKKRLEQVKEQAKQIEEQITDLKQSEKELKTTLTETKDDKHRISIAKKKIQDELNRAKETTEKVIKSRFETDRFIDKTTRAVKDLVGEIDRIKNDRVYINQQTSVLKVELQEAEDQIEDIKVEKKRVLVKKQEIQENLMEKEIELNEVIVEKEIKLEETKKQHRETIDKMKRQYESSKKETHEDRVRIRDKLVIGSNQLLRQEYEMESEKRQLELQDVKTKTLERDVRFETMEKEVIESEMIRIKKESVRVNQALDQEREINMILEEKNKELYKEKSVLRETATKAAIESYQIQKEIRIQEEQIETFNTESNEVLIVNKRIEMSIMEETQDLDSKKAEIKDEKRRIKKLLSSKKLVEKEELEKIESQYSKDLLRLKSLEEMKAKEIKETSNAVEDLDVKQQRFNDRMVKTQGEIESLSSKMESLDMKKLHEKKRSLENTLLIAKGILDDKKKDKDQVLKDYELTMNKQKSLNENLLNHNKQKKTAEQMKKDLEEKLQKLKSHSLETSAEHKKWVEEAESKARADKEKIKKEMEKDQAKLVEKLESQTKEEQEDLIKKKESQISRTLESIQKAKSEEQRIADKIQNEKEDRALALERKKRKEERERKLKILKLEEELQKQPTKELNSDDEDL